MEYHRLPEQFKVVLADNVKIGDLISRRKDGKWIKANLAIDRVIRVAFQNGKSDDVICCK